MKTNPKNIVLIALIAIWILPPGCKKGFLDQKDSKALTTDAAFQKSSDVVALVNGIYDTYQSSDLLKKSLWYYNNYQTHDFFNFGSDVAYNIYAIPDNFGPIEVFWSRAYVGIARANLAIAIIPGLQARGVVNDSLGKRLTGEAYFLRGMTYYYLAASFGGVPLELSQTSTGLNPRSTQDQVFAQVVADMKQAEKLLVSKKKLPVLEIGRATIGAAYGYEGAAQMWLKNYSAALTAFNNPELTANYRLLPNFIDVNEYVNKNSDESLFEVQFDTDGDPNNWAANESVVISVFSMPEELSYSGFDYGNPGLYYSYQAGDTRKLATIIGPGDANPSPGIIARGGIPSYQVVMTGFANNDPTFTGDDGNIITTCGTVTHPWYGLFDAGHTGYYCSKMWRDPTINALGNDFVGSQNQILLRYAEVLLDKAECQIRTGDITGGLATLKIVRDRAWGGASPAVMQDGANFDGSPSVPITDPLQMVYSEYRHELAGEYSVFYDLRRAGVAAAFIQAAYGTVANSTNPIPNPGPGPTHDGLAHGLYNTSLPFGRDLYPIPLVERGRNPNLTQNPAYGN